MLHGLKLHGRNLSSVLVWSRVHNRNRDRGGEPIRLTKDSLRSAFRWVHHPFKAADPRDHVASCRTLRAPQARGESLRGQLADRSAQGTYASMYQATNTANANTITPAQYQPTNTSSLIGRSSLLPGGIIHPFFAPARRDAGSLTARTWRRLGHRHRGAAYRADIARAE